MLDIFSSSILNPDSKKYFIIIILHFEPFSIFEISYYFYGLNWITLKSMTNITGIKRIQL